MVVWRGNRLLLVAAYMVSVFRGTGAPYEGP
jgi:hypothetical protein